MRTPRQTSNITLLRRNEAFAKLGVKPEDVNFQPDISSQLKRIHLALRKHGYGGSLADMPFDHLKASDSPDAKAVLEIYFSMTLFDRRALPIEAICLAASVSPLRVLELIVASAVRMSAQSSAIIAAISHPRVVEKTVAMALTDNGIDDRNVLHKATGFLPTPKGAQTTIQINQSATANAQSATVAAPPPEQTIRRLVDRFHAGRASNTLTPATIPALPIVTAPTPADDDDDEDDD